MMKQLDFDDLAKHQQDEAQFNTGYCYLNDKQLDKALPYFNSLKINENKYTYASAYYAGNIEFKHVGCIDRFVKTHGKDKTAMIKVVYVAIERYISVFLLLSFFGEIILEVVALEVGNTPI